jgi:hypothetical protein
MKHWIYLTVGAKPRIRQLRSVLWLGLFAPEHLGTAKWQNLLLVIFGAPEADC